MDNGSKVLPGLTYDHISANSYSIMRVNLPAQVFSASVAPVLREFCPAEAAATSEFCEMVNSFFDCFIVRTKTEHQKMRKAFLAPYTNLQDERFQWLMEFLAYLRRWKESTENRLGNFTQNARSIMFLSWEKHEFKITVNFANYDWFYLTLKVQKFAILSTGVSFCRAGEAWDQKSLMKSNWRVQLDPYMLPLVYLLLEVKRR